MTHTMVRHCPAANRPVVHRTRTIRLWRQSLGSLVILLCSACAGATVSTVPAPDAGNMIDARLLRMTDTRQADTLLFDEVLRVGSNNQRARAALAVGQVKMQTRYPMLRHLLVDPDTAVAANAAYALGLTKDTASISALARAVAGAPDVVAREAAWSLGEIGNASRLVLAVSLGEGVSKPLEQSAAAQRSASVRAALLLSMSKMRPLAIDVIKPWLADASPEVVRAAAYAFGRPRVAAGARALLTVQRDPDEETRQHVARGLVRQAVGDSLAAEARAALASLIADPSARVRMNAARSLATFGPAAMADYEKTLSDADANVRVAATESAQTVFGKDTVAWRRAWNRDTTFRVREQLLGGARAVGVAVFEAEEQQWMQHPDWRYRIAGFTAYATDTKADRLNLVRTMLTDADDHVRENAFSMIPNSATDGDVRLLLQPLYASTDPIIRTGAFRSAARRATAADIPIALTALRNTNAKDEERMAAYRLVASAWARDSAHIDSPTQQSLRTWSAPAAYNERQIVAHVTPMLTWVALASPPAPRPLEDYQRLVRQWYAPNATQPRAVIHTDYGDVTIELFGRDAPLIVESFVKLAKAGFYQNTTFHRVVPNFVVQDGDGSGAPVPTLRESYSRQRHERGAVGLATSGPDTGGSQYYLCHSTQPHLDGGYTVFGRVIDGLDVMDRIVQGDRMIRIEVK